MNVIILVFSNILPVNFTVSLFQNEMEILDFGLMEKIYHNLLKGKN